MMLTNPLNNNRQHQNRSTQVLIDSVRGFGVTSIFYPLMICLLSLLFLMSGCMVGPDFVKPDAPLEDVWTQQEDSRIKTEAADNREWWTVFDDPVLNNLIEQAYQQNLDLQVAGLRILEARAELGIAIGGQYPQTQDVTAGAQAVGLSQNSALTGVLDNFSYNYSLGLDAAWELDFWGRFRRGVESANASLYATYANYDDVLVSLIAEVASTYTQIRTFEQQLAFTRANVKIQEKSFELATDRYEGGATSELDPTIAKALLTQTQASIPQFEAGLRQAKNALAILLGIPPIEIQNILGPPKPIPIAPPEVVVGIPADLLLRRPDIRRIELAAAAQSARIGVAKSDLFPRISLAGSFLFMTSDKSSKEFNQGSSFGDLFSTDSITYFVGPQIQWPILNYGRIKNDVRAQDARFQQFLVEYRNTVLRAMQDVEDGMVGFLRAQERQMALTESVKAYQRAVDLAQLQYIEGLSTYQRVIDGQRFLTAAQFGLATAKGAVVTNLIATYKALGGGWELREGRDLVPAATQEQMRERTDWGDLLSPEEHPDLQKQPPTGQEINILHMPDF